MKNVFDQELLDKIARKLISKNITVAVAESVTGGLMQFSFSGMTEALKFYQGGICAYNLGQKYKHLNVEPIHAELVNCVSPKVAKEMALNVSKMFNSDWGIGITGYATPVPESDNKVYAYYSITTREKEKSKGKITSVHKNAVDAQILFVKQVLQNFYKII